MMELDIAAAERLRSRAHEMETRWRAYQLCFSTPAGGDVLQDLAKFCREGETLFHTDPRVHALLEGRRETLLHILRIFKAPDGGSYPPHASP